VSDAAVASDTENHVHVNRPLTDTVMAIVTESGTESGTNAFSTILVENKSRY
jgi:hypothetical protein